jgi:hypothetical protein
VAFDLGHTGLARPDPLRQGGLRKMASLAQGTNQSAETEFRFDEIFFGRGKLEEFADRADLPTAALESFSLSFVHGVSSFLKAA